MKVLSLFSGAGLGDYGWELAGHDIVGQVEIDEYCQQVLALRWPHVPKWRDIRTVDPAELPQCDLIAGGFPCQPFSVAGQRRGAADERNMWPEMLRIIAGVKPTWVLAENVPGVLPYLETVVLDDLESLGYETLTLEIPACAVGAKHRRSRLFIFAHANIETMERQKQSKALSFTICDREWTTDKPGMDRVAYGVPHRVDRLTALGNGQVVQVVKWIGTMIAQAEASWHVDPAADGEE